MQPDRGVEQTVERDVLGLDEQVDRDVARREQLERAREPVVVVHERAGDHELVQQDAVVVEPRRADPGADEHERPGPLQLRERGFHRRGCCPEHSSATSNGSSTMSCGIAGMSSSSGCDGARAELSRTARGACRAARSRRCRRRRAPCSAATERNPIGPPPVTSQRVPGRAPPPRVMPCSATASGSASAACFEPSPSGMRSSSAGRDRLVARRTRPASRPRRRRPGPRRCTATAGPRGSTRTRRTGRRPADDPVARPSSRSPRRRPRRPCRCTRGPRSRPRARPTRGGSAGRSRRRRSG